MSLEPCKSGEESTHAHGLVHFAPADRIAPLTPRFPVKVRKIVTFAVPRLTTLETRWNQRL